MGKENSQLPCIANPDRICDCPLKEANAYYLNNIGNKCRSVRSAIQRQGYDRVSVGLIVELLRNPFGRYYTESLDSAYPFSKEMRDIRQRIIAVWKNKVELLAEEHPETTCPELKNLT